MKGVLLVICDPPEPAVPARVPSTTSRSSSSKGGWVHIIISAPAYFVGFWKMGLAWIYEYKGYFQSCWLHLYRTSRRHSTGRRWQGWSNATDDFNLKTCLFSVSFVGAHSILAYLCMDLLKFLPKLHWVHVLLSLILIIVTFDNCTSFVSLIMQLVKSEIVTSPLSLRRDSFISPGFEDFFSVVTLKFDFLPWKWSYLMNL